MPDDTTGTRTHQAGAFDIRNMIAALMGLYGVILTLAGLLGDRAPEQTGGVNANLSILNGAFNVTLPDAPCRFSGNVSRSVERAPLSDPMTYNPNRYSESYQYPNTQFPASGPYDFTIDTVPVTVNVIKDGTSVNGNSIMGLML